MSSRHFALTLHLLLFLLVYADSNSQTHYFITPSLSVDCPGDPCLTLPQLAANSTSYLGNEANISLFFLPGNHSLDGELSLSHADNFSMTMVTEGNGTVYIECGSQSGKFNISETTFAMVKDLHFVGCGGNRVSQVEQFIVEDTIFEGVEGRGTALVLNQVTDASITSSSFLSNVHAGIFEYLEISPFANDQQVLKYLYLNRDPSLAVGGALYATFSNVSIVSSKFTDNRAEIGGALFAHNSSLHVVGSTYSYNKASFAGVMITSESSINIKNSNFIENAAVIYGGVMIAYEDLFNIHSNTFTNNSVDGVGVILTIDSMFSITDSNFSHNAAKRSGGVICAINGSFIIAGSIFTNNSAASFRSVLYMVNSLLIITSSTFTNNSAASHGGVMSLFNSIFNITNSTFTNNSAADSGGVMRTFNSIFNITNSTFTNNSAASRGGNSSAAKVNYGGAMVTFNSIFNITSSTFTNNSAAQGGIMLTSDSSFNITGSTFTNSVVADSGGVMITVNSIFNIISSTFTNNSAASRDGNSNAANYGGVMVTLSSTFNITSSTFTNNSAADGGVAWGITSLFNIIGSNFYGNKVSSHGGIMFTIESSSHVTNCTFYHNSGSLYIFYSNLTFSGYSRLENSAEQSNKTLGAQEEGGAITSFQSTLIFTGVSRLSNNQARRGGAILAIESKIMMYGETTIANNTATVSSGGGISLQQSDLEVRGNCIISGNDALRGGGIHATSSTVTVYQPWTLQFINNRAESGSGLYLEINAKLYVLKIRPIFRNARSEHLLFRANHANYGGAIYVADNTNAGACSPDNECFIQTLALHRFIEYPEYYTFNVINTLFFGNTASQQGANIFGGLLDRCIPSPFAEVYRRLEAPPPPHYSGVSYLGDITNITALLDTISSLPVRVCFCKSESEPDCDYQPPTIKVKKGEAFTMPLVAVDQVNHSVDANIISSLSSQDGGFSEGQQTQSVGKNCSNVKFNVFSRYDFEIINLFADGPCGSSKLSTRHLYIEFSECTCPVGFHPLDSDTRCGCDCDSKLSPHIISCNLTTKFLVRVNTNSWITHINDTDPPGYIIHPNCPLDYCQPPTENVSMNLNLPDGADAQCAYNRSGVLCGGCQKHFSLSLGSSRCLSCHSHWPAALVVILLATFVVGILLVTALLALNMTVAVGLINGFIFYANIVAANNGVFFPSSEPSFPTVFVAWLNLDIGIDVCFFDGLDTYIKTWLQLAFPVYIISLVIIVIIVSEYSPRFAGLIGKKDPIATLATLILLSYAKLLSVTITALSFAVLDYPDGAHETVWLPDGNVPYFRGKHVALVLIALLIILVGAPYTILLFLWQWLVRAPEWKVFKWTRNTKLNAFISVYHAPYNSKYRYWTGLLLLVRVVLYITASVTVSRDPQTSLLITIIIVGSLFLIKEITGVRVYKKSFVSFIEAMLYFNLLALSAFSWYRFKIDATKQTAVAYTSTIITFILLVGVIVYHVYLLIRKDHPRLGEEVNEYPLAPVQPGKDEVTFSVIEIPKPRDQSPTPEENNDQTEVKEIICTATPVYQ